MIACVARAHGQTLRATRREPYWLTLRAFYQLQEHERIQGIERRLRALDDAGLQAAAFHEPKRLGDLHRATLDDVMPAPMRAQRAADQPKRLAELAAYAARTATPAPEGTDGQ